MPEAKEITILLVDDQASIRALARQALNQVGIVNNNITDAREGGEALQKLKTRPHTLVISDWNMEPVSGIDLLKQIRGDPMLEGQPFIMMTGNADRERVKEAITAGVNNYIVKPFNGATIKKKIEAVIGKLS